MLEKLLSLFLQAKGGAVATVLVLGTSGALVTATVENGMTKVAITQETTDQSGSTTTTDDSTTTTTVEQAILALFTRTNGEEDPTSTATAKGCSDEAHARNEQKFRVNDAFKADHLTVVASKRDVRAREDRQLVRDAGKVLRDIRQAAVKAIHGTFDCDPSEDEDGDNEDEDNEDENGDEGNSSNTTDLPDFTGLDAEAIADLAIEAMAAVVEDLTAALGDDEETTPAANTKGDGKKSDNAPGAANANKGKGNANANGKGRGGERN